MYVRKVTTLLTYDRFLGEVSESLGITRANQAAGEVEVNTVLHRVNFHVARGPQHSFIIFSKHNNLVAICLFLFLKKEVTCSNYLTSLTQYRHFGVLCLFKKKSHTHTH